MHLPWQRVLLEELFRVVEGERVIVPPLAPVQKPNTEKKPVRERKGTHIESLYFFKKKLLLLVRATHVGGEKPH